MYPQRAGSGSREARWVSVPQQSQQSISEEEAAVPHPPLLTRSNTNRHSAYFDAMQQLDGAGEQEAMRAVTRDLADQFLPGDLSIGGSTPPDRS